MINIKVCKEAYSDSGRVVQIDNDGTVVVSSVRTSVGMTQTGSGTPSTSNKRPIVRWNNVVTHRSNSEDDAGTEYTTDLGRDGITAFEIDVVKGEVTVTGGFIESYNGETLTGEWLSDRDAYVSGGTPSVGAQVAYELAQPYSFAVTPQYINLVDGLNYLWIVINGSTIRNDEYEGESISFTATDTTVITDFDVDFAPIQDGTPWQSSLMQVPYIFQRTPQLGHDYNKEFVNAIVGGTVAWNQLWENGNFDSTSGWETIGGTGFAVANHKATVTCNSGDFALHGWTSKSVPAGHVGIALINMRNTTAGSTSNTATRLYTTSWGMVTPINSMSGDVGFSVFKTSSGAVNRAYFRPAAVVGNNYSFEKAMLIDLTALFGSATIADYLYSLEQTTAGSGIAKLKEWGFDIDSYHAHDTGSLQSVNTSAHETTGKNLLDVLSSVTVGGITFTKNSDGYVTASSVSSDTRYWNYGNAQYKCKLPTGSYKIILEVQTSTTDSAHGVRLYDNGGALLLDLVDISPKPFSTTGIKSYDFTLDKQTEFGVMAKLFAASVRFMIVRSDANTDYEPYVKHSYPLDSDVTLRGIPKLDSSNNLYYDGDVYEADGTVNRKSTLLNLSTLEWLSLGNNLFRATTGQAAEGLPRWAICSKYCYKAYENGQTVYDDKSIYLTNNYYGSAEFILIKDTAYSDLATFQVMLQSESVQVVLEAETPTTETADPYTAIQTVDPYGTEQYIDYGVEQGTRDIAVPVGHQTSYGLIVPIEGHDELTVYVSPTEDETDATVYTIDLDGTRYGGTVDAVSGKMTVTMAEVDLGSLDWRYSSYGDGSFYASVEDIKRTPNWNTIPNILCSIYNADTANNVALANDKDKIVSVPPNASNLTIKDKAYTDANEFKYAMNGIKLVYELATPIEVQLTPTEVQLLIGTNHIWSDENNIVRLKTRTFGTDTANESIDVDYNTTVQYDGIMCGNGIIPEVKM